MTVTTRPFDPANYINSAEAAVAYLDDAFADGDPAGIADAIGAVARAGGMSKVAGRTGFSRTSLYRALSRNGNPELATIVAVLKTAGLRLSVRPIEAPKDPEIFAAE